MCESRQFVGLLTRHHRSHGYICTRCKLKVGSRSYNSALQPAGGAVWPRSSAWGAPGRVRDRRRKVPQTTEQVKESAEWEKLMVNSGFCVYHRQILSCAQSGQSYLFSPTRQRSRKQKTSIKTDTEADTTVHWYHEHSLSVWCYFYFFYKNQAEDLIWVFSHWSMTSVDHNVHKHGRWHHR